MPIIERNKQDSHGVQSSLFCSAHDGRVGRVHNRPSHAIPGTSERAVNEAVAGGEIPTALPFIHREAIKEVLPAASRRFSVRNTLAFSWALPTKSTPSSP
jgi:hypothetical protein